MAKLLIVEDDPKIARFLTDVVLMAGHLSLAADSTAKAWSILESEEDIAALIIDHHLGEGSANGMGFLAAVRQSPRHGKLPAIVCTGDTRIGTIGGFVALEVDAFLKKPFRAERLLSELERLFQP